MAWLPSPPRDDLREIYLGTVLSPSTFYVSEPRAVWSSEDVKAITDLEAKLNMEELQPLPRSLRRSDLCSFMPVEDGHWRRGKILKLHADGKNATILLIDHGNIYEDVPIENLRRLPESYSAQPQLAFQLTIPGLSPIIENDKTDTDWSPWIKTMVSHFVEASEAVFISDIDFETPTNASGELFLQFCPDLHYKPHAFMTRYRHTLGNQRLFSLGEFLSCKGFATIRFANEMGNTSISQATR